MDKVLTFLVRMLDRFFLTVEFFGAMTMRFLVQRMKPTITSVCDWTGLRPTRIAALLLAGSLGLDIYGEASHGQINGTWAFNVALWVFIVGGGIYVVDLWIRALERGLVEDVPSFVGSFLRMHAFMMLPILLSLGAVVTGLVMAAATQDPEGMWFLLQFCENVLDVGAIVCTWTLHIPKGKKFSERVREAFASPVLAPVQGSA